MAPTIGIDLDGTIAQYDGWRGHTSIGPLLPGAIEFLHELKRRGYQLVLFSARACDIEGRRAIAAYLIENKIMELFEGITHEKLYKFAAFVDDRAIAFKGNYDVVLGQL